MRAASSFALRRDPREVQREHEESERLLAAAREAERRTHEAAARIRRMNSIYRERLEGIRTRVTG